MVGREGRETHENQGGVEVFVVLVYVFRVILRRLSFVHGVEVEVRIFVLDRLEVHP